MKRLHLTTAACLAIALAGCTTYQQERDLTQPMKFKKAALIDDNAEWYMMTTVIEAPWEAGYTFPGEASELYKVKWVIEKDNLFAYRTTEFVRDTEFASSTEDFLGEPVAAYRIESHFDVWYQYNPVTGEEMPIKYEATERPWWEREWIRVDWSTNGIAGFDYLFSQICKLKGSIIADPVGYFPTQPDDPEQFYVAQRNEDGSWTNVYGWDDIEQLDRFDYIDVVNREFVHLDLMGYIDLGCQSYPEFPLTGGMQITYRHSFMKKEKRPIEDQYKPLYFPDQRFERFGYFRTDRGVQDPVRGLTDFREYHANRWNIFSGRYDADGDEVPVADWTIEPILYYFVPDEKLPSTRECDQNGRACVDYVRDELYQQVADDWNEGFRDVLRAIGHPEAETARVFTAVKIDYSCGPNEDRACQDLGDLRYSFMWNHDLVNTNSPLGYGPSWADPETGEIIGANANFYGGVLRRYAGQIGDIYDLVKGNLSELEIITGENIRAHYESVGANVLPPSLPNINFEALNEMRQARAAGEMDMTKPANMDFKLLELRNDLRDLKQFGTGYDNRAKIIGTSLEKLLVTPEMMAMGGVDPSEALTEEVLDRVSPLRTKTNGRAQFAKWDRFWAEHSVWREAPIFVDVAYEKLIADAEAALQLEGEEPNRRTVADWILRQYFRGVENHEVGHTVGLRHNFQASFDEDNYYPEYWDIQDTLPDIEFGTIGETTGQISSDFDVNDDGVLDVEEIAEYERQKLVRKREQEAAGLDRWTMSSVMDYAPQFYNQTSRIGRYDTAALKYAYAETVEIYSDTETDFDAADVAAVGGWDAFKYRRSNRVDIPYFLGGERCLQQSDCPSANEAVVRQTCRANLGRGNTLTDAAPGVREDLGVCTSIYAELEALAGRGAMSYPNYHFCSDERRSDRPFCNVWDEGKSAQEIVENLIERYERNYIFSNFRGYRGDTFQPYFYINRIQSRYYFPMGKIYQSLLYGYYYIDGYSENLGDGGFLDSFLASRQIMNFMAKIIATPDIGSYFKFDPLDVTYDGSFSEDPESWADIFVPIGVGKYLYSKFETGYFGQINRYARMGTFYDKIFAIETLTRRDWDRPSANDETFPINFYDAFQDEMLDLFSNVMADEMPSYAPVIRAVEVVDDVQWVSQIEYRDLWQGGFFGSASADFAGLEGVAGSNIDPATRYAGEVLDAGGSIYVKLYALLFALLDFPVFYDANFPSYVQLYQYGRPSARDQAEIDAGELAGDLISFQSADREITYVVPQTAKDRSMFWRVLKRAKAESAQLDTLRSYAGNGGAPVGFSRANQMCGKLYNIDPDDPGADEECLTKLLDSTESALEDTESYLSLSMDFLRQLDHNTH